MVTIEKIEAVAHDHSGHVHRKRELSGHGGNMMDVKIDYYVTVPNDK